MERAKLIRYTKHPRYRYLDEYVYECIDCGEEFTRATNAKNINPYCGKCYRKRETEKQRERNRIKRNNDIIAELEKIKAELNNKFIGEYEQIKYTSEYGDIITLYDLNYTLDKYIEELKEK